AAEDALAVLEEGIDAELALAALLARRRNLREEAARILGRDPGDHIEWALRHHRIEVRGGGDRTHRLRAALESAGMMLGAEPLPRSSCRQKRERPKRRGSSTSRRQKRLACTPSLPRPSLRRARHRTRCMI